MLVYVQLLVWLVPRGKLVSTLANGVSTDSPNGTRTPDRIKRLERAIAQASKHGLFRPKCLVRAIALQRMIEAQGYPGSRVQVGVRWNAGEFQAHAWVDYKGIVLGDDSSHVAKFELIALF